MFNKLTCKVHFHIAVWSLSKSIRASSFIENFPQISAKPIGFQLNLLGKLSQNRPFFTNRFSAKLASKIPAKSAVFSANLPLKIPRNLTFFPRPTRSLGTSRKFVYLDKIFVITNALQVWMVCRDFTIFGWSRQNFKCTTDKICPG